MNPQTDQQHERRRVLIVDDEPLILSTLSSVARGAGFEVGIAADGRKGLDMFCANEWDIVVTDRNMPNMDGEQMTAEIKKLSPNIPVILITARWNDVGNPEQFLEILGKPFSLKRWLACLETACPENSHASAP